MRAESRSDFALPGRRLAMRTGFGATALESLPASRALPGARTLEDGFDSARKSASGISSLTKRHSGRPT